MTTRGDRRVGVRRPPAWYWATSAVLFAVVLVGIWFFSNGLARLEHGSGSGLPRLAAGVVLIVVPTLVGRLISKRLGNSR